MSSIITNPHSSGMQMSVQAATPWPYSSSNSRQEVNLHHSGPHRGWNLQANAIGCSLSGQGPVQNPLPPRVASSNCGCCNDLGGSSRAVTLTDRPSGGSVCRGALLQWRRVGAQELTSGRSGGHGADQHVFVFIFVCFGFKGSVFPVWKVVQNTSNVRTYYATLIGKCSKKLINLHDNVYSKWLV